MERYNLYCDESCHLERDCSAVMVLGAIWCPTADSSRLANDLRDIKRKHGLSPSVEIKWTKVSPAKVDFYLSVIDYFFDSPQLHYRGLLVPDKSKLEHQRFEQTHDDWYYKMYFDMLKRLITPQDRYRIYVDIKDNWGGRKVQKLHEVLSNNMYDFSREVIEHIQIVRSHESELMQLVDLISGAVGYVNRGLSGNSGKVGVVTHIQRRSGYKLTRTTLYKEEKLNLFRWAPWEGEQ